MNQQQDTTIIPLTSNQAQQQYEEEEEEEHIDIDASGVVTASPTYHNPAFPKSNQKWMIQNQKFASLWRLIPTSWSIERNPDIALPNVLTLFGFISLCIFVFSVPSILQIIAKEAPTPPGTNPDIDEAASIIKGSNGAVAADNQLCSELGVKIMQQFQGNAIDAMVSTVLCQGVLSPFASGIGGGAFILIHNQQKDQSIFYNARETAPLAATMNMYKSNATISKFGGLAVAVPGELKGLHMAHKDFGKLSWQQVVTPVITIAEEAKVGKFLSIKLKQMKNTIFSSPSLKKVFTKQIEKTKPGHSEAAASVELPGVRRKEISSLYNFNETFSIIDRGVVESLKDPSVITDANDKDKHGVKSPNLKDDNNNETHIDVLLEEGDKLINPKLIKLLKRISIKGSNAFYIDNSEKLAKEIQAAGGVITANDIKNYQVEIQDVIRSKYHGFEIIGVPVPSIGGSSLAMALNMIKELKFRRIGRNQVSYHLLIETLKFVFGAGMGLGDMNYVGKAKKQMKNMLSRRQAIKRVFRIDKRHTYEPRHYAKHISLSKLESGTSHISIIDKNGTGVSVTSTINLPFGSGILSESSGIILNDQMDAFTTSLTRSNAFGLYPSKANNIEGGKRPLSSMCPTIILHDEKIYLILGGSGGPKAISGVIETILNIIDFRDSLSDAISAPRIHHQLVPNVVSLEGVNVSTCEESHTLRRPSEGNNNGSPTRGSAWPYWQSVCEALKKIGHKIEGPAVHGAVQAVLIPDALHIGGHRKKDDKDEEKFLAASDPRKIGRAAAY